MKFSDHEERLSGSDREEDEDDIEAALKKEVGQIRASTEQKLRRFQSVESGANNVVFIRTQGIGGASADAESCKLLSALLVKGHRVWLPSNTCMSDKYPSLWLCH